jgi:hypothetical protein
MGAPIGVAAGTTAAMVQVNVPSQTLLEFRLEQPASLPEKG